MLTIDQVNQMDREQFVREFGGLFQKSPWVAEQAFQALPFTDVYDLRKSLQDAVFDAAERQLELIRSYPQLGTVFSDLTPANRLGGDQAMAGLDRLDSDEHQTLDSLTQAYQEKFDPLVIAVRENTKETIMRRATPGCRTVRQLSAPPPWWRSRRSPTCGCSTGSRSRSRRGA